MESFKSTNLFGKFWPFKDASASNNNVKAFHDSNNSATADVNAVDNAAAHANQTVINLQPTAAANQPPKAGGSSSLFSGVSQSVANASPVFHRFIGRFKGGLESKEDKIKFQEPMDPEAFRLYGKQMVDYVADYWSGLRSREPQPNITPGSVKMMVPNDPPEDPESWNNIFADIEPIVLQGTTHWHHPHFFAYYPTANSYPAILGDILSSAIACIGFTWNASPACTELEMAMTDWLAKATGLPEHFMHRHHGPGGGVIQCTASDSTLVSMLAARARTVAVQQKLDSSLEQGAIMSNLVAYCSDQAHSSVERAALLAAVKIRKLPTNDQYSLTGSAFLNAIREDRAKGLMPFYLCVTLGTTNSCAFDKLDELAPICQSESIWCHVDAAYAGSAFVCQEYRHWMKGIETVDSFNYNPHKFGLVNFDCSPMWFKDSRHIEQAFHVDPAYLKHDNQGKIPDFRHWQIPLGRRFRSLKIWFVLRAFGVKGLREHVRKICLLAAEFEQHVRSDERFEVVAPVALGLVCFRIRGPNALNEALLKAIQRDARIHLVNTVLPNDLFTLRFAVCSTLTTADDVAFAWRVIQQLSHDIIASSKETTN